MKQAYILSQDQIAEFIIQEDPAKDFVLWLILWASNH